MSCKVKCLPLRTEETKPMVETWICEPCTHYSWRSPGSTSFLHLTRLCLSKPESCCLTDPNHPPTGTWQRSKSLKKNQPSFERTLQHGQWASQDSAQQSRAEGNLAADALVQNQTHKLKYWKGDARTLSQTPLDALKSAKWNIDGASRFRLLNVCRGCTWE